MEYHLAKRKSMACCVSGIHKYCLRSKGKRADDPFPKITRKRLKKFKRLIFEIMKYNNVGLILLVFTGFFLSFGFPKRDEIRNIYL